MSKKTKLLPGYNYNLWKQKHGMNVVYITMKCEIYIYTSPLILKTGVIMLTEHW